MNSPRKVIFAVLGIALLASTVLLAQNIPVRNWTVPVFDAEALKYAELRPFTHTQGNTPAIFVPFGPCRLTDSRVSSGGPGPIAGGGTRDYDFVPSGCGGNTVSEPILAWSLNFSVVNTAGPGFLLAYPTGGSSGGVSILNYTGAAGEIRNNAAIVPVNAATGSITVQAGVSATDVIIDTNGLFLAVLEDTTFFHVTGTAFSTGVITGENTRLDGNGIGVWGSHAGGGWGVYGTSVSGTGVVGIVTSGNGVFGQTSGTIDDRSAIYGDSYGTSGRVYGGRFYTASANGGAAGVIGFSADGAFAGIGQGGYAGVLGIASAGRGVKGIASSGSGEGVCGTMTDGAGTFLSEGCLGYTSTTAVQGFGNIAKTGTVSFAEPHPTDATKMVKYVSLEGNEAGTYFRGRARFQNGIATIDVPDDFRIVTQPEGLSIQVTPIGDMASVAVAQIGLDRIVVKGSRNVEFFYTVNGIRRGYGDFTPIVETDKTYIPDSPDARMPQVWDGEIRNRLIANGTYKPDGTVNMETAQRLGWDRVWAERESPRPAPQLPPQ